uniref:Uncharacterized protein n=1 Tax=Pseudoalteromonas luteoviolacea TaxID=43657 RepID=A0A023Q090_9GAMM|nr:hypothetical protein [Pseudoalteromonas luteoviolacea]
MQNPLATNQGDEFEYLTAIAEKSALPSWPVQLSVAIALDEGAHKLYQRPYS